MQDNEKIIYNDYDFLFDKDNFSRGEGIPIFKDVSDIYGVIENFVLVEITNKGKDFAELGKYLDYNFRYNSYQGKDFLHFLYFIYEPYFNHNLKDVRKGWVEILDSITQYEIADFVKNWIESKVKLLGKKSLIEIEKGSIISEMYATFKMLQSDAAIKTYKPIQQANAKSSKIIAEFQIEMNKPRATQSKALGNLSERTDLGVGDINNPNIPSNRKYIHDILKSFGLALKENKAIPKARKARN